MARESARPTYRNQLLSVLPSSDLNLLTPYLTSATLGLRDQLELPNKPIKHIYFPESGVVSVVANGARKKQLEIGIIGREGG
jgi:hypothetical protein